MCKSSQESQNQESLYILFIIRFKSKIYDTFFKREFEKLKKLIFNIIRQIANQNY